MHDLETPKILPGAGCRWFAVHTRHHHEKTVAALLVAKGFQVFFPKYEATRRWADRWKRLTLPLFPGYLFFANEIDRRLQLLCTPGVQSIVQTGSVPAPIPNEEIQQIRRLLDSSLPVEPHPFLKEGDRVRINAGPLAGLEGLLSRKKDGLRLVLSVQLLGRSAAVSVDARIVEPVRGSNALRDFARVVGSEFAQPSKKGRVTSRPSLREQSRDIKDLYCTR
jgi:transcription antitermination factor NusG